MIRAKGFFWLATRPHHVGELSQAGPLVRTNRMGRWWASVPQTRWPDDPGLLKAIVPYLDLEWGDRRQEIVFIGADPMDQQQITEKLDACLVPAARFTPTAWENLPDPFARWA